MTDMSTPPAEDRDVRKDPFFALAARVEARILAIALVILLIAAGALSWATEQTLESELVPELTGKAETVADILGAEVARGIGYGIPIEAQVGVDAYFAEVMARHPEIVSVALIGGDGTALSLVGAPPDDGSEAQLLVSRPVPSDAAGGAVIRIGLDRAFIDRQFADVIFDILTILLVAMFVTFEIVLAALFTSVVSPIRQLALMIGRGARGDLGGSLAHRGRDEIGEAVRLFDRAVIGVNERYAQLRVRTAGATAAVAARVAAIGSRFSLSPDGRVREATVTSAIDARLALFAFVFAEELQKSFLPLYVAALAEPVSWLSPEVMAGLPISVYMGVLALATPFSGRLVDRYGARAIFLLGIVPAFLGFVGAALAQSVTHLLVARGVTAVGYAMITIACQGYIAFASSREGRARGMSIFVGTLMSASICGTAMGGILADRLGYRAVFGVAAAFSLLAAWVAWRMLRRMAQSGEEGAPSVGLGWNTLRLLLGNIRFLALVVLAAIPGKVVLTGFLFLAVPTYLAGLDATEGEIGRVMMLYSIGVIFVGPWISRIVDSRGGAALFVAGGTLLSGIAMMVLEVEGGFWPVVLAVVLLALAHAVSIAPQIAMVPELCSREVARVGLTTILAVLRMSERIGSVAGPILVGALAVAVGLEQALFVIGAAIALLSLLLPVLLMFGRRP